MEKVEVMIDAAGKHGVNVLCLQEAWHMPFAFCTREKHWAEFAEPVDGDVVAFCQRKAKQYAMVLVCPILERDTAHGDVLWNTAVVIGHRGNVIGTHRKVCLLLPSFLCSMEWCLGSGLECGACPKILMYVVVKLCDYLCCLSIILLM